MHVRKASGGGFDQKTLMPEDFAVQQTLARIAAENPMAVYQAAPRTNPEVEAFLAVNPIEPHAASRLRSLPPEFQAMVIQNSLEGARDPTAVVIGRIRMLPGPECEAPRANPEVEAFLANNTIEPHAASRLRSLPPEQQQMVIQNSLVGARDPTAVVIGRIRNLSRNGPRHSGVVGMFQHFAQRADIGVPGMQNGTSGGMDQSYAGGGSAPETSTGMSFNEDSSRNRRQPQPPPPPDPAYEVSSRLKEVREKVQSSLAVLSKSILGREHAPNPGESTGDGEATNEYEPEMEEEWGEVNEDRGSGGNHEGGGSGGGPGIPWSRPFSSRPIQRQPSPHREELPPSILVNTGGVQHQAMSYGKDLGGVCGDGFWQDPRNDGHQASSDQQQWGARSPGNPSQSDQPSQAAHVAQQAQSQAAQSVQQAQAAQARDAQAAQAARMAQMAQMAQAAQAAAAAQAAQAAQEAQAAQAAQEAQATQAAQAMHAAQAAAAAQAAQEAQAAQTAAWNQQSASEQFAVSMGQQLGLGAPPPLPPLPGLPAPGTEGLGDGSKREVDVSNVPAGVRASLGRLGPDGLPQFAPGTSTSVTKAIEEHLQRQQAQSSLPGGCPPNLSATAAAALQQQLEMQQAPSLSVAAAASLQQQLEMQQAAHMAQYQEFWVRQQLQSQMALFEAQRALGGDERAHGNKKNKGDFTPKQSSQPMLPGDWLCPACGDHQFSRNRTCRHCGAMRPPETY